MPYAKSRESIFGSVLTSINLNTNNSVNNKRKTLFQNWIQFNNKTKKLINNVNSEEYSRTISEQINQNKCCKSINNSKLHISKLTDSQKTEVLKYFNSIKTNAQQNEYLKALVIPTNFIQKSGTKCPRSSNYD